MLSLLNTNYTRIQSVRSSIQFFSNKGAFQLYLAATEMMSYDIRKYQSHPQGIIFGGYLDLRKNFPGRQSKKLDQNLKVGNESLCKE